MMRRLALKFALTLSLCFSTATQVLAGESLTVAEVKQVLAQAIQEAQARNVAASIAVTDRVGNVLAVYDMAGVGDATITSNPAIPAGISGKGALDGFSVPARAAAIAKAITGAYLSSGGNAFTSRTAGQIVQEHFNPRERFAPSGPLFGVQFSQLPCSDLNISSGIATTGIGPKRSPLGLSADPGGLPLYKNNEVIGGIGVMSDGIYSIDLNVGDFDTDNDEMIALAGTVGFDAPIDIRANRITVEGKTLRFTDRKTRSLASNPAAATGFDQLASTVGTLNSVATYFDGTIRAGTEFGTAASGYRADNTGIFGALNAFVLVDALDQPRYAPKAGTEGTANSLTASEVGAVLRHSLGIAFRARAQIRRPLGSHAQVTISVVDTNGEILGLARTPDGPVFGTDVSLQKARTAAFFSNKEAGSELTTAGHGTYVDAVRALFGANALQDGTAFADRSGGNLSRPYYPDGINFSANGPFSKPINEWSPFNTGLQLDLVLGNIATHANFLVGASPTDTSANCTGLSVRPETSKSRLANGMQIFPGSVPIYRGSTLIGGVGVSGDGVDQDDMIAFLGLHNAGLEQGTGIGNAPIGMRADNLAAGGARLRYVNCPFAPFLDSGEQTPCNGK